MKPLTPYEQALWDAAQTIARGEFNKHGEMEPLLMAMRADMQLGIAQLHGLPKGHISEMTDKIKQHAACVLLLEAWITTISKEESPAIFDAAKGGDASLIMPPRECLNRKEVVMFQFFHKERHILTKALITRPKEGKPTLGEWDAPMDALLSVKR